MKLKTILVPVREPSARTRAAARKAAQVARASGATIELFHAFDQPLDPYALAGGMSAAQLERDAHARALKRMEPLARSLRKAGVSVRTAVASDYPAYEAVIREALRTRADLIVADTHSRHIAAGILGFTDWELLRYSPVPVLLVRNSRRYGSGAVLAAVDPQHAQDKSARVDRRILDAGASVARALGASLHVMHAYAPLPAATLTMNYMPASAVTELVKQAAATAKKSFARLIDEHRLPRNRSHLVAADPVDAIPGVARQTRAQIVVMGVVARSELKRLLLGNTAERVLDRVDSDVLAVGDPKRRKTISARRRGLRWITSFTPL